MDIYLDCQEPIKISTRFLLEICARKLGCSKYRESIKPINIKLQKPIFGTGYQILGTSS